MKDFYALNINNQSINSENCVKLLGMKTGNTQIFDQHISNLYEKASNQLNVMGKIQKHMGLKGKGVLLNSFFLSNLI